MSKFIRTRHTGNGRTVVTYPNGKVVAYSAPIGGYSGNSTVLRPGVDDK